MDPECDNIILLSLDALRADHLSCYGYNRETSPEIDELAEEAYVFENAYSASSHTREAVPALLTGKYPDEAVDPSYRLATETIASLLSEQGFATAGFHSNPYVSRAYGFDRGFDEFDDDLHFGKHRLVALAQRAFDKFRGRNYARAEEINDRSLSWLDSLDENPFFLWNHYMDTHGPYEPPGEYRKLFQSNNATDQTAQSLYQRAVSEPDSISEEERELMIDLYDAEIRYNDTQLGKFIESLRRRSLLERSLLIVTADHGDAFNEHGYYGHPRHLHKEVTHVPLIVRPPGGADGEWISTPVSTLDIATTILANVGLEEQSEHECLLDLPKNEDRRVFQQARGEDDDSHLRRYSVRSIDNSSFCERDIETGKIKYDDTSDATLKEKLQRHVDQRELGEGTQDSQSPDDVSQEVENRLGALGYKE